MNKKCKDCEKSKDISEFHKRKEGNKFGAACKVCVSIRNKEKYDRTKHGNRKEYRRHISIGFAEYFLKNSQGKQNV